MIDIPINRPGISWLALFVLALAPSSTPAQIPGDVKPFRIQVPYDGPEVFARLMDHAGLKPIPAIDRLEADVPADKSIVIVFGDPDPLLALEQRPGGLGGFLRRGGTALIASERPFSFNNIRSLGWSDVRFEFGDFVNLWFNYRGQSQCPLISPRDFAVPEHPVLRDITGPIATNRPGVIAIQADAVKTLVHLPRNTLPGQFRDRIDLEMVGAAGLLTYPYVAAGKRPDERVLLVAGHGVFTNCMTAPDDIENRRFAHNVIQWLKEGKRTHVLFFHEGQPITTFQTPLAGPPRPPIPSIEGMNRIIDAIQNEGVLQKIIDRTIGPERIVRGAILLGTFGLLLYGVKKFFQSRWTLEETPAVVGAPAGNETPLVKQQMRELAQRDRLGEPARALARDWLRTYANVEFQPGRQAPDLSFNIHAGPIQRKKLAKHLESLWQLASDPVSPTWDAKRLRGLVVFLEELTMSVAAGEVVFEPPVAVGKRS